MKNIQMRYNILHFLYWITACCIFGYVAVFLQYKGMSNTLIGVVSGGGCLGSLFISPFVSSLLEKIKGLTIKKLILSLYIIQAVSFFCMTVLPLPAVMIIALYIAMYILNIACVPFLSTIAMNYIRKGTIVNFGLARGMGSISYAISAVVLGKLIAMFNPAILVFVFLGFGLLFLANLLTLPDFELSEENAMKKMEKSSPLDIIKNYPIYFIILIGFGFQVGGASSLGTYLINIVRSLGADTSFYGVVIFAMAASEMPIMAITPKLMQYFKSEQLLGFAGLAYIARNFTISLAPNLPVLVIGGMFQSISYGLFLAVITYYVTSHLKFKDQVMGQTMITMMTTGFGSTLGNIIGGILQDSVGLSGMLVFSRTLTTIGVFFVLYGCYKGYQQIKKD